MGRINKTNEGQQFALNLAYRQRLGYKNPMVLGPDYRPEFESLAERLVELAQLRNVDALMRRVVAILAERPHVALARIWLADRGDLCASCHAAAECADHRRCLHLVASAGTRPDSNTPDWSRTDGEYQRIPLGVGKVGRIGATGQAIVVEDFARDPGWLQRYAWAARLNIRGFNAQPIKFNDEVLGVIAIFTFIPTPERGPAWMRIFADEIAGALVNARAFEEIERLRSHLEVENLFLRQDLQESRAVGDLIGEHESMRELLRQIQMVAPTDATVLILGESGTGKELVARELHRLSQRSDRPLIRVNCASVPRELYESEFFGHVKGAFTGAIKDRGGRFEAADGGTLFLDEVGEIPLTLQSKFLRVLQEKQYERVGEERTRTVDVRIIAATNRDLKKEVEAGRFREDLYYRLNVFPLRVPALRERREDIPLLTRHFLEHAARRLRLPLPRLTEAHIRLLQGCDWPGNVRELQNATERALILARNGELRFDVPASTVYEGEARSGGNGSGPRIYTDSEMRLRERQNVLAALEKTGWKIHGEGGAAELLGLRPTTLISRLKKMGLSRPARRK